MTKLHEVLGKPLINSDLGIEIECEGAYMKAIDSAFWKTEDDGSLRGEYPHSRAEFVLKKPIPKKYVEAALDDLINNQKEAKFKFSFRTSTHVHVNCLGLTLDEFAAFAYLYLMFEDVFIRYCGEERRGNRFCLRVQDAEQQQDALFSLLKEGWAAAQYINQDSYRYSAMNLAALPKYGSVEFRSMRGTMDKEVLLNWTSALISLRDAAVALKDPIQVHRGLAKTSPKQFFIDCVGKSADAFLYDGMEEDIVRCVSLNIEVPFLWRDNNHEEEKIKPDEREGGIIEVRPWDFAPQLQGGVGRGVGGPFVALGNNLGRVVNEEFHRAVDRIRNRGDDEVFGDDLEQPNPEM
jgi:hypothetical protein